MSQQSSRPQAWAGGRHRGPDVPPEFANVNELGAVVEVCARQPGAGLAIVGAIISGVLIVLGAILAIAGPHIGGAVVGAVGVALLALSAWGMSRDLYARSAVLYAKGFAARWRGRVVQVAWDDIASVTTTDVFRYSQRGASRTWHGRIVRTRRGEVIALEQAWLANHRPLFEAIEQHHRDLALPALQTDYDAGKPVAFGSLIASRDGITLRGRHFAWDAVRSVETKNGVLIVTPESGAPAKLRTDAIPDVGLLAVLIGLPADKLDLTRI